MAPQEVKKAGEEEDTPFVKSLKSLDDKVLAMTKEYEAKRQALQRKYTALQKPMLDKREKILSAGGKEGEKTGTPALPGFWLKALRAHPELAEHIESHDAPVLEYLKDIVAVDLDPQDSQKGFRLKFIFAENPYFSNSVLSKEVRTDESNPYADEMDVNEINGCKIDWKKGKDVTVSIEKSKKSAKAPKGSGNKKGSGKEKEEPRASFFRTFFRTLKKDGRLPDSIMPEDIEGVAQFMEGADEEDIVGILMEQDHEAASVIRDFIIPYAVRFYTGEAVPQGGDDDDDEDDEEESGDDDDEDSESDSKPTPKGGKKASPKTSPGKKPKKSPKSGSEEAPKEECKQQ